MPQDSHSLSNRPEESSQLATTDGRANGRLAESLLANTHNPALTRLAGVVRGQISESIESYSRMHNRHNRS
jgi:hypothetical protein